jgi:Ca2+-binding EF-hand superfamily protein
VYPCFQIPGRELSSMLFTAALTIPEMARVLAIFKLLDRDNDGFLKLSDLQKAQGIEKKVVEDVLEVRRQQVQFL